MRKGSRKRRWAGAFAGAAMAAGALLVAGLAARIEQTMYWLEPTHATYALGTVPTFVTSETGWKQRELLALLATKDGATQAAARILSVLPEDEEPEKVVEFGTIWTPGPFAETTVGWPVSWMTWGHEDLATGSTGTTSGWRRKGWHINEARAGQAWYAWDSGGKRLYFGMFVPELATLVLLGWIVWKGLRLVERVAEWRLVRKRVKRGWCVVCGYDLAGIRGGKGNE